jgi:hypothetical protein
MTLSEEGGGDSDAAFVRMRALGNWLFIENGKALTR